ncbi:MAG: prepilin-type N-terminal cleavage/methylation domain-containing protein [Planctomycetes bacterium]|nr:prepilin-type N-terminal cleavage/methylation domain-containing protein [Planctomycetota bacterium]
MNSKKGFTLIEVMAAVMLLAIAMSLMLQLRNQALSRAIDSRSESIASRMGLMLLHRIEAARMDELYDGSTGDFSEEGFPDFSWVIGIGDGSPYAAGIGEEDAESAWRLQAEQLLEDQIEGEQTPEFTRIFLTVSYPGADGQPSNHTLETLLPTWAIQQDFELYEATWPGLLPLAVE